MWCFVAAFVILAAPGGYQKPGAQLPPDEDVPAKTAKPPSQAPATDELPPDEDAAALPSAKPAFNPVQSDRDVMVGQEYFRKGNFKAAADRFLSATQHNSGNAKAWLLLAESQEKRDNLSAARAAYERYLQLSPEAKNANEIRKKLEKLK
jgi:tetratricopeptide (TPR) repeat protein